MATAEAKTSSPPKPTSTAAKSLPPAARLANFDRKAYCASFFIAWAAALSGLRLLDAALAPLEGEPLLQHVWEGACSRWPWLLSHAYFAGVPAFAAYMASCIGFTVLDLRRNMSTKLQKGYWPSVRDMVNAGLPQVLIYTVGNVAGYVYGYQKVALPALAPTLPVLAEQLMVMLVVGDFLIYWEHRLMHAVPYLRYNIHSWHHAYHAPFSWAGGVVHPLEDVVVVACQVTAPVLLGHHPLCFWIFVSLWTLLLVEEHSGHEVSWAPYHWMPFARCPLGGGAAPHDIHHYKVNKNYGFCFCVWDHLFGTFEAVTPGGDPRAKYYAKSC